MSALAQQQKSDPSGIIGEMCALLSFQAETKIYIRQILLHGWGVYRLNFSSFTMVWGCPNLKLALL